MSLWSRFTASALSAAALIAAAAAPGTVAAQAGRPNIVFVLMDNLGFGELGVYGGGERRGTATPRIDALADEGLKLTNYNVEPQAAPSRSAIMTGRFSVRTGAHAPTPEDGPEGLTGWEVTLAEVLSQAGYATSMCGTWRLGDIPGRLPTDQGFDEWYGVTGPGAPTEQVLGGRRGERSRSFGAYDLQRRRLIDETCTRRSIDFMKRSVADQRPFYAYIPYTQVRAPALPNPGFAGKSAHGDLADAIMEADAHVGELLDAVDRLGVAGDTIFIFTSSGGPETTWPWLGSAAPWRGSYGTHLEGGLRVPFIVRWPDHVPAGGSSDEIVHAVDTFTTLASMAGAEIPVDRPIDSIDQSAFLLGRTKTSARTGFPVYVANRLEAVKWRNRKVVFYDEPADAGSPPEELKTPKAFDLAADPQEEHPHTKVASASDLKTAKLILASLSRSLGLHPPIAPGTADPYEPPAAQISAPSPEQKPTPAKATKAAKPAPPTKRARPYPY